MNKFGALICCAVSYNIRQQLLVANTEEEQMSSSSNVMERTHLQGRFDPWQRKKGDTAVFCMIFEFSLTVHPRSIPLPGWFRWSLIDEMLMVGPQRKKYQEIIERKEDIFSVQNIRKCL